MIPLIKRIIKMVAKGKARLPVDLHQPLPEPEVMDFADLHNSLYKRSWSFELVQKELERKNPRLLHWIGSINYSGYQRQESLSWLISNYQSGDENRIMLRLADWVEPVSELARQWIIEHCSQLTLEQLNAQYRLILFLARKERLSGDPALTVINQQLLVLAAAATDRRFGQIHQLLRRYIYRLAGAGTAQFRGRILHDREPYNRAMLLEQYRPLTAGECEALQQDRSVYVRRKFFHFQLARQEKMAEDMLVRYCLDTNKSIRDMAKFYLEKWYERDPYQLFREQTDFRYYFIADYARKEDLPVFMQGFADPGNEHQSLIRYLCFKAICQLDYALLKDMNPVTLLAASRKIRRLAAEYLPRALSLGELLELEEVFYDAGISTFLFLAMVDKKSNWQFVDRSLQLIIQEPSEVNIAFVQARFNRRPYIYEPLTGNLKASILAGLQQLADSENQQLAAYLQQLEFVINSQADLDSSRKCK